jgi:hypothetical protein
MRALVLLPLLLGCTGGGGDTGATCSEDDALVTWDNWGDGFFGNYCRTCHSVSSEDRHGAPEAVNFDVGDDARAYQDDIRRTVIEDASMPIGGGVLQADLDELDVFLRCGL